MIDYAPAILTIIAGPNGSGKSTIAVALGLGADASVPFINPDIIASVINPTHPEQAALKAGKEALRQQLHHLQQGKSFAAETTLAGRSPLRIRMHEDGTKLSWPALLSVLPYNPSFGAILAHPCCFS